jgi:hypothetical protein
MALYIGSTNVIPGIYPLPSTDAYSRGASLVTDGSVAYWTYPGSPSGNPQAGWRYRAILTHGFSTAGYKGSNPWRSLNKTWHTTDITYYCGDQLTNTGDYIDGFFSDYNGYTLGCNNGFGGTSAHTESYNLYTGTGRVRGGSVFSPYSFGYTDDNPAAVMGYGTVGGWDMGTARRTFGASTAITYQYGYAAGGASPTEKMHMPTEVMYNTTGNNRGAGSATACGGQEISWWSIGGGPSGMYHSSDSWFVAPTTFTTDGFMKFLPSKYGWHYVGTQSNVNTNRVQFNDSSGSAIAYFNQISAYGEDVMMMGQDWGYMTGNYDGQQNNKCDKTTYSNNAQTRMSAASRNKGHYGASSGSASSAAALVAASGRPGV